MFNHFSMGAINKITNRYEYPKIANKSNKYKCPFCEKNVIFRNGKIKKPHFAHYKSDNPCSYYTSPNESQIHKDAKLLMKTLLDNKNKITFYRKCNYCLLDKTNIFEYKISENDYNENTIASIEYKFNYNNSKRSADVALLENKQLKYIFEIYYTHSTKENDRPEPWFEIKAEPFINLTNSGENINEKREIEIECIRTYKCICCKNKEEYEKKNLMKILEKLQIKEKEENELLNMSKEDERTISKKNRFEEEIKLKRKKEEQDRELERKKVEEERELKLKKEEQDREFEIKIQTEKIEREKEFLKNFLEKDKKCDLCNINYCKCNKPNFINNEYNKIICNSCKKYKCICVRITNYFKIK